MSNAKGDYGSIPQGDDTEAQQQRRESLPVNNRGRFPDVNALAGEFFGTATLVQIGCAANCINILLGGMSGMWQVGAVWTLGAMMGIYISAAQSGGHLNPAVSLAFALVRPHDFPFQSVIPYWIAQLAGAFVAGVINIILFTTAIKNFEADLKHHSDILMSAAAFGDYWRYVQRLLSFVQYSFITCSDFYSIDKQSVWKEMSKMHSMPDSLKPLEQAFCASLSLPLPIPKHPCPQ